MKVYLGLATLIAAGCGINDTKDQNTENPSPTASSTYALTMDMGALQQLTANESQTRYEMVIQASGENVATIDTTNLDDVKKTLGETKVRTSDTMTVAMTFWNSKNQAMLTNIKDVAEQNDIHKQIWQNQCQDVSTNAESSLNSNNQIELKVRVCDFSGSLASPAIRIQSQAKITEARTVIYHCRNWGRSFHSDSMQLNPGVCDYGYKSTDSNSPTIEVPARYAPGTAEYEAKMFKHSFFYLYTTDSGKLSFKDLRPTVPFGSFAACHTMEMDVQYGSSSGAKSERLVFKRNLGPGIEWRIQNKDAPHFQWIAYFYSTAKSEAIDFFFHCTWIPTSDKDNQNVTVIEPS